MIAIVLVLALVFSVAEPDPPPPTSSTIVSDECGLQLTFVPRPSGLGPVKPFVNDDPAGIGRLLVSSARQLAVYFDTSTWDCPIGDCGGSVHIECASKGARLRADVTKRWQKTPREATRDDACRALGFDAAGCAALPGDPALAFALKNEHGETGDLFIWRSAETAGAATMAIARKGRPPPTLLTRAGTPTNGSVVDLANPHLRGWSW